MTKKTRIANAQARESTPAPALGQEVLQGVQIVKTADNKGGAVLLNGTNRDAFKYCGSSHSPSFNVTLFREVLGCLWVPSAKVDDEATGRMVQAAGAALKAFKPADEIEGMIAAQAVACHFAAMECLRRTMIAEQPAEIASRLRKDAANLMRTMTEMLETLDQKRGKGPQVVRVERVVVHEGGQAIVGNVAPGGEGVTEQNQRVKPMRAICGAKTRRGGPCKGQPMPNGRCRMHGGPSTGPRTPEGLERLRKARTRHGGYSADMNLMRALMRLLRDD